MPCPLYPSMNLKYSSFLYQKFIGGMVHSPQRCPNPYLLDLKIVTKRDFVVVIKDLKMGAIPCYQWLPWNHKGLHNREAKVHLRIVTL